LKEIRQLIWDKKTSDFSEDSQGTIWLDKRICVPNLKHIKELILREDWWYGMKRDVTKYVVQCDTCQRVKAEHQRGARLLQPLKIPEWKWEEIELNS
jgi:hypothetical protein